MKILFATILLSMSLTLAMGQEVNTRPEEKEQTANEETTSTEKIQQELEQKDTVEVYNLCGQLVATSLDGLNKGVYIVKQNGTSRKIVVR